MPQLKAKKATSTYQLLVIRQQTFQFEVKAKSAEDACRKLLRNLKGGETNHPSTQVFASWSDPAEPEEVWIVMQSTSAENSSAPIQVWDGKQLSVLDESESTYSIAEALTTTHNRKSTD